MFTANYINKLPTERQTDRHLGWNSGEYIPLSFCRLETINLHVWVCVFSAEPLIHQKLHFFPFSCPPPHTHPKPYFFHLALVYMHSWSIFISCGSKHPVQQFVPLCLNYPLRFLRKLHRLLSKFDCAQEEKKPGGPWCADVNGLGIFCHQRPQQTVTCNFNVQTGCFGGWRNLLINSSSVTWIFIFLREPNLNSLVWQGYFYSMIWPYVISMHLCWKEFACICRNAGCSKRAAMSVELGCWESAVPCVYSQACQCKATLSAYLLF